MQNKKNNFKNYQTEKVAKRLLIIEDKISEYKKTKKKFENITEMAESLAKHIGLQENSSCSSSTILRNVNYKALIESYFNSQAGKNKVKPTSNFIAELTLSNMEGENMRLKQYISLLEGELENIKNKNNQDLIDKKSESSLYLTSTEGNEANLRKALTLLIKNFDGLIAFNENGDLIDLSKKVNNVIVKKELIGKI